MYFYLYKRKNREKNLLSTKKLVRNLSLRIYIDGLDKTSTLDKILTRSNPLELSSEISNPLKF